MREKGLCIRALPSWVFKGYLYLIDVPLRRHLDHPIEVIKGRLKRGELALLKTRSIDHHVDEAGERWKRLQKVGWRATSAEW
ncbi:hypothetical protein PMIT1313_02665 [Prochlorococcus marinus str. MIT 1313]|nr:hypothetical protein PMIT1313_02665 [Prochlorococcus marinus str. MIT 1313]KZR73215.1 hypothetical protein PMIT1318_00548 [Prochlorococcus marinus str. MIT 1318]